MDFYYLAYTQELQNFIFCCLYFSVYVCTLYLRLYILKFFYFFIDLSVGSGGFNDGFIVWHTLKNFERLSFVVYTFLCMHAPYACVFRFPTSIHMQGKEIYIHICIIIVIKSFNLAMNIRALMLFSIRITSPADKSMSVA